ncbi:MAG TPA: exodeoxyribonuclease V subunit gamma, partial [Spirochaetota bacterium]|nr:exodeoxyribonuclease V subunit gamma [Spirochaetota bacterium]
MSFYVYQSNRLEKVIPTIASVLAEKGSTQKGSKAQELLSVDYCLVQSIGMGRYFALELASELGIFANYKMVYPNAFMRLLASHLKIDDAADSKESIGWKIFSIIKNGEIENEILAGYIESARIDNKKKYDELKLFTFAYSLADLFDQYSLYRPSMVTLWDRGEPVKTINNIQQPLDKDELWQYELWRKVYDGTMIHKAEIREKIISRINGREDLPFDRFFILGVSTIPLFFLEVIYTISKYCDVYAALLSPSDSYWEDIVNKKYRFFKILEPDLKAKKESTGKSDNHTLTGEDNNFDDYYFTGNTILGSNGMLGRDFNRILSDNFEGSIVQNDSYYFTEESDNILGNIQRDIRELNDRGIFGDKTKKRFIYDNDDRSLQIHGVHSKRRELEVLHDNLLEIMQKNPDIELRDILVMTPSVYDYAPYIKAVFEEFRGTKLYLDYSIADLALDSDNETVPAFLKIISLYKGRFTSGDIISLLRLKPLSAHAKIDDENIENVAEMLNAARFRWGRDGDDRKELLDIEYEEFSFAHAFKRIIHSTIFVRDFDQTYNGVFPSDDFDRDSSVLAGCVLDFVLKLEDFTRECSKPRPVNQWEELLRKMVNDLFSNSNDFSQSRDTLFESISAVCANSAKASDIVSFEIIESLLITHLSGESRAFGFIDGRITFCEM